MIKTTVKTNGNGKFLRDDTGYSRESGENLRLRKILQKAVNRETVPENLRETIRKMIRQ